MIEPNERKHEQSSYYDFVGEILDGSSNTTINLTSMVFGWFFEGRDYNFNSAACVDEDGEEAEEGCERYVQVRHIIIVMAITTQQVRIYKSNSSAFQLHDFSISC